MKLLDRDEQYASLLRVLEAGAGRTVAICGAPGMGRSALLAWCAGQGTDRGLSVCAAAGALAEQDLPFGLATLLLPGRVDAAADRWLAFTELLAGLSAASGTEPIVLLVDDVQWADPESLRFLHYLQRRIATLNCVLIFAARVVDPNQDRSDVVALIEAADVRLDLGPLSLDSVEVLAPDASAVEWHEATGGNPQLITLLAADLTNAVSGEHGSVAALVRSQLSLGSSAAAQIAAALAVFGRHATVHRLCRLSRLGSDDGRAAVLELVRQGLVVDAIPPRFRQPILAEATRAGVGAGALAHLYATAAQLLAEEGESEAAAKLYDHAEPASDPATVAVLRRAAELAVQRADPAQAARYLTRALAEPPQSALRAVVSYELGRAESRAGITSAVEHLRQALEGTEDPHLAARIALVLSETGIWSARWEESLQALDRALEVATDPATRDALALQIAVAATGSAKVRAAAAPRLAALREIGAEASAPLRAALAVELAMTTGPAERVIELASACVLELDIGGAGAINGLYEMTAAVLGLAGGDQAAIDALDAAVSSADVSGSVLSATRTRILRGFTYQQWGRPKAAVRDLRAALEIDGLETFNATQHPAAAGALIDALLDIDGPVAARAVADELDAAADADAAAGQHLPLALARVALAEHRPHVALAELEICRAWEQGFGGASVAFAPWRPLAVRAHLMAGNQSLAQDLAAELSVLAEAYGSPRVRAGAVASQGLVNRDLDLMGAAVELYTEADHPVHCAEVWLDIALMRRALRQEKQARQAIRAAMASATAAGADFVGERVRRELRISGGRLHPEPVDGAAGLTPAELRAARMAASGLTNREIAQTTFLSHRTVEMHLSNAYRKLGVSQRNELAAKLASLGVAL